MSPDVAPEDGQESLAVGQDVHESVLVVPELAILNEVSQATEQCREAQPEYVCI
jgi:hypothetical protein